MIYGTQCYTGYVLFVSVPIANVYSIFFFAYIDIPIYSMHVCVCCTKMCTVSLSTSNPITLFFFLAREQMGDFLLFKKIESSKQKSRQYLTDRNSILLKPLLSS